MNNQYNEEAKVNKDSSESEGEYIYKTVIEKKENRRTWSVVSLALGILSVLSLFVSLWAVLISLYAVPVSLAASALGCLFAVVVFAVQGFFTQALLVLGAVLLLSGFAIVMFLACNLAARGCVWCTKMMFRGIKRIFIRKRGEENA